MAGQYGEGGRGSPAHGGVNLVAVRKVHNMYILYIYVYIYITAKEGSSQIPKKDEGRYER
jgi:hypothetical protein